MLKVIHSVTKMDRAGQETFIMNLYRKIDRSEIQFDFLCSDHTKGEFDDEICELGGSILYLPKITLKGPLKQLQKIYNIKKVLSAHPCDVYHVHTHHAMDAFENALAAKLCKIKTVVVHSHNTSALYHIKAHKLFRRLLGLLGIRRFACSYAAGEWMHPKGNFRVIHNGLDLDSLYFRNDIRNTVREEFGWQGKRIIGHVGRFNEQKNHRFLINIFDEMHKKDSTTHLVMVGKGELEDEIRELVKSKGLTDAVTFMGVRNDVGRLYQGMDMLLFPSLFEGLSVVLVEAQACDLPCFVSDRISEETVLTDRMVMKKLEDSAAEWAEDALKFLEDATERTDNRGVIRDAGYDIAMLARSLPEVYLGK